MARKENQKSQMTDKKSNQMNNKKSNQMTDRVEKTNNCSNEFDNCSK